MLVYFVRHWVYLALPSMSPDRSSPRGLLVNSCVDLEKATGSKPRTGAIRAGADSSSWLFRPTERVDACLFCAPLGVFGSALHVSGPRARATYCVNLVMVLRFELPGASESLPSRCSM
jgi:hypothetical protein